MPGRLYLGLVPRPSDPLVDPGIGTDVPQASTARQAHRVRAVSPWTLGKMTQQKPPASALWGLSLFPWEPMSASAQQHVQRGEMRRGRRRGWTRRCRCCFTERVCESLMVCGRPCHADDKADQGNVRLDRISDDQGRLRLTLKKTASLCKIGAGFVWVTYTGSF